MCGISGFSHFESHSSQEDQLNASASLLHHRGPDDAGSYLDKDHNIGLAHTRLSILDLSPLGHQPMLSEDGLVVLVFNGEIYNFQDLRRDLEGLGHHFRGKSDTEVLLHMYLAHRESDSTISKMLNKLNGIFSFAIWDSDVQALLVVRDALGVKPLYYSLTDQGFSFSSEIKALPSYSTDLDIPSLDRYLSYLWCPGDGTPLQGVRKVGPGQAMWVKSGAILRQFTWYRLPIFHSGATKSEGLSRKDSIRGTESHLREAVHRQMVADVPVGAFLSGGLDSSSVVAFACEQNPDIRCFTIEAIGGDDDGVTSDLPFARQVASHLNVPLDVVRIDANRMAEDLVDMVAQLDEPIADPAPLNVLYISRLAREHGIKVLLSGAGGDDLFTGYRRHLAVHYDSLWNWLPTSIRSNLETYTSGANQHHPLLRRMSKLLNGASLDGDERLVNYFRWVNREDLTSLYTDEFRSALGSVKSEEPMLSFLSELSSDIPPLERMLALEQRFFLTDHNLTYTDKMSMAVGVEVRVPFLDLDLVEFAAKIPSRFKQRGGEGKWVLKKAMEPYLPREVIYRPKTGFGAPLRRWMRFELRELLADILGRQSLENRGLFDIMTVEKLIQANDNGEIDASYTLLSLMCIELWCRRFIDQTDAIDPNFNQHIL